MFDLYVIGSVIGVVITLILGTFWILTAWEHRKNGEDLIFPIFMVVVTSTVATFLSWIWVGCTVVICGTIYGYYYYKRNSS